MTSRRTRDRLVQRLRDNGIRNEAVLEQIRNVPRHLFVPETYRALTGGDPAILRAAPVGVALVDARRMLDVNERSYLGPDLAEYGL